MRFLLLLAFVQQIFARSQPAPELTNENFYRCVNPFALDLLKKLEYENKNVVYSPLSIAMAVGMLIEGAKNQEKDNLQNLLHCHTYHNSDSIHQHFKTLIDEYKDMPTREKNPRNATVEIANLLMIKEGFTVPATFTDALKKDYEASVGHENFATNGQQVVEKINKFVKERTHGLIPELLSEPLDPSTMLVLINTIYFKAYWEEFFIKELTHKAPFYNADKTEKNVDTMRKYFAYLKYYHSDKLKASFVELPYLGEISMIIVVPDEKYGFPKVIQNWTPLELSAILPQMNFTHIDLHLPKFDFSYQIDLKDVFKKLGVNIENALQAVHNSLKVSGAVHKSKISTNEAGTEAAAVTAIFAVETSLKPQPKIIKADHPFLGLILDKKSHINLFTVVVNQLN